MKLKRVVYCVPLLLVSLVFAVVAVRFKENQQRAQATRELVQLCKNRDEEDGTWLSSRPTQQAIKLLHAGADPNARTLNDNPLLCLVCKWPDTTSVQVLQAMIAAGAHVNVRGQESETPLLLASQGGTPESTQCCRILLAHHADLKACDDEGNDALLYAASSCPAAGHCWSTPETARVLLDKGASLEVRDADGNTPLAKAISNCFPDNGSVAFVQLIVQRGASLHHRNKKGQTSIAIARQILCGNAWSDHDVYHIIAMLQHAIKQHKSVKSSH